MNADERKSAASIIACYPINESTYNIDRLLFDSAVKMLAHIDSQAEQIATLKAALIRERERYLDDFIHQDSPCEDRTVEAISQLAHWRPELFSASEIDAVIEKTRGVSHDNRRRSPIHGAN